MLLVLFYAACPGLRRANAGELVMLRNGFSIECDHLGSSGSATRLFLDAGSQSYVDVRTAEIASTTLMPPAEKPSTAGVASAARSQARVAGPIVPASAGLSQAELRRLLAGAGQAHDLDVDLLASVVDAESRGNPAAHSRAGAEGLMQLMPGTAAGLGIENAYVPEGNVRGGTAYLDALLHRYHDNLPLALAAYNAGPAAVARWGGVPPYRETRTYVARIIHEFNTRYAARRAAALALAVPEGAH